MYTEVNLVVGIAMTGIFLLPTLVHLALDQWQRGERSFSLIPHKKRHFVASLIRLGLIYGALRAELMLIWCGLGIVLFASNGLSATDRRLTINDKTGLVKWRKISLPWWPVKNCNTGFVDHVGIVNLDSYNQTKSLLGVGDLKQLQTNIHNGNRFTSGHYSKRTITWIAEQVNDYLEAFKRHDSKAARASRDCFRKKIESSPRRKREAARTQDAQQRKTDKKKRVQAKQAAKIAKKKANRERRIKDKFKY